MEAAGIRQLELALRSPNGKPLGDAITLATEGSPRIDARYHLRLKVRPLAAVPTRSRVQLLLRDRLGTILLGAVPLDSLTTEVAVDLSNLCIEPGYLPPAALEMFAEVATEEFGQLPPELVETRTRKAAPAAGIDPAAAMSQTLTAEQLAGLSGVGVEAETPPSTARRSSRRSTAGQRRLTSPREEREEQ